MERINVPAHKSEFGTPVWQKWFNGVTGRMNMYSGAANPVSTEVPNGQWIIYKNTTANEIRLWVNDNGTMKKSVALT